MDADQPAEAPRERLGDRLEQAIEHRADLPGEVARGEQELDAASAQARRSAIRRTVFWLVVSGVSLYLVAPSIIETFSSWEQIQQLSPAWLAAMAGLQAAALACIWVLQRVSIPGSRWQPIIAAHLTGCQREPRIATRCRAQTQASEPAWSTAISASQAGEIFSIWCQDPNVSMTLGATR